MTVPYVRFYVPAHPLADAYGVIAEHRMVLFEKIGPGTHPCHYCAEPVTWKNFKDTERAGMLVVDHIDTNRRNNDPDNLVPSCSPCNTNRNRSRPKIIGDDELFEVDARGWRHRAAMRTCEVCGVEFLRRLWQIKKDGGRYCSNACSAVSRRKSGSPVNSEGLVSATLDS